MRPADHPKSKASFRDTPCAALDVASQASHVASRSAKAARITGMPWVPKKMRSGGCPIYRCHHLAEHLLGLLPHHFDERTLGNLNLTHLAIHDRLLSMLLSASTSRA